MRVQRESIIQQNFMQWLKLQYRFLFDVTCAIPNQGRRSYKNASRMKAEGMKKGMPDVVIFYPSGFYHGMFIEFKSEKGKPSVDQIKMMETLTENDYYCCYCYSLEDGIREIRGYLNNER